jgi:hypothetical protein
VWKDLVSRTFNSTKGMQLGAPYKEIKINYDVNVFFSWLLLQHQPLPLQRNMMSFVQKERTLFLVIPAASMML